MISVRQTTLRYYNESREADLGKSWWCRLMKPGQAYQCGSTMVMIFAVGKFAALGVTLKAHSAGCWTFEKVFPAASMVNEGLCLVEDPKDFMIIPYSGARVDSRLVLVETNGDVVGMNLVQYALHCHRMSPP